MQRVFREACAGKTPFREHLFPTMFALKNGCATRAECGFISRAPKRMLQGRQRMQILYTGHVQGVGFRYSTKMLAQGYEVIGIVRNLLDGRVELIAEGTREELEAFRKGVQESELGSLIR